MDRKMVRKFVEHVKATARKGTIPKDQHERVLQEAANKAEAATKSRKSKK